MILLIIIMNMNVIENCLGGSGEGWRGKEIDTKGWKVLKYPTYLHMKRAYWNPPNTVWKSWQKGGGWKYNRRIELNQSTLYALWNDHNEIVLFMLPKQLAHTTTLSYFLLFLLIWGLTSFAPRLASNHYRPTSTSQIAGITGMGHTCSHTDWMRVSQTALYSCCFWEACFSVSVSVSLSLSFSHICKKYNVSVISYIMPY
jgi:hypothetical protein